MDMRQFFNFWKGHSDRQRQQVKINAILALQLRIALNKKEIQFSDLYSEDNSTSSQSQTEESPEEFKKRMDSINADFDKALEKPQNKVDVTEAKRLGLI